MYSVIISEPFHVESLKLNTDCSKLYDFVCSFYGKYISENTNKICYEVIVEKIKKNLYYVIYNDKSSVTDNPLQMIENFLFNNANIQKDIFAIHAGAVCYKDKAYIFTSPTNTGKTTLTSYLSLKGLEYVTDDCAFIDMQNYKVYPFQAPIHLREGGLKVLQNMKTEPQNTTYIKTPTIERYIFTPTNISPDIMNLGNIFFIERTEDKNKVIEIPPSTALLLLLKSSITPYKITAQLLSFLSKLAQSCKLMKYSNMEFVLNYIKDYAL